MRGAFAIAFAVLSVCGSLSAQTPSPGCTWEGDPAFRFGWGATYGGWPGYVPPPGHYHQPGYDTVWMSPGMNLVYKLGPCNAPSSWLPAICKAADTLCFEIRDTCGWPITCAPAAGTPCVLPGGYLWTQNVLIYVPCSAPIGSYDMIIATCAYVNNVGVCDTTCGDCVNPDFRPTDGKYYYSKDTLFVIVAGPDLPAPAILQDTLSYIETGQRMAYVPFSICNDNPCFPMDVGYHIWSMGYIGPAISVYDTVTVPSGRCADVFGVIDAGLAEPSVYDTLHVIAWTCRPSPPYDTCVQRVVTVTLCGNCAVPLFTLPVLILLVLALILVAALFMRSRAARRR